MVRLVSKSSTDLSTDHEANFRSLAAWLQSTGVNYNSRLPGEHEKVAERSMRRIREGVLLLPYKG